MDTGTFKKTGLLREMEMIFSHLKTTCLLEAVYSFSNVMPLQKCLFNTRASWLSRPSEAALSGISIKYRVICSPLISAQIT